VITVLDGIQCKQKLLKHNINFCNAHSITSICFLRINNVKNTLGDLGFGDILIFLNKRFRDVFSLSFSVCLKISNFFLSSLFQNTKYAQFKPVSFKRNKLVSTGAPGNIIVGVSFSIKVCYKK
jgi:hypothetical protein